MPLALLSRRGAPAAALVALSNGSLMAGGGLPADGSLPAGDGTGCPYLPRCPISIGRCRTEDPPLAVIAPEHEAACFRAGEAPATAAAQMADEPRPAEPEVEIRAAVSSDADAMAEVFEANERARRLYAKAGYTPDGSTRVEPEYEATEIRLVKALP